MIGPSMASACIAPATATMKSSADPASGSAPYLFWSTCMGDNLEAPVSLIRLWKACYKVVHLTTVMKAAHAPLTHPNISLHVSSFVSELQQCLRGSCLVPPATCATLPPPDSISELLQILNKSMLSPAKAVAQSAAACSGSPRRQLPGSQCKTLPQCRCRWPAAAPQSGLQKGDKCWSRASLTQFHRINLISCVHYASEAPKSLARMKTLAHQNCAPCGWWVLGTAPRAQVFLAYVGSISWAVRASGGKTHNVIPLLSCGLYGLLGCACSTPSAMCKYALGACHRVINGSINGVRSWIPGIFTSYIAY